MIHVLSILQWGLIGAIAAKGISKIEILIQRYSNKKKEQQFIQIIKKCI